MSSRCSVPCRCSPAVSTWRQPSTWQERSGLDVLTALEGLVEQSLVARPETAAGPDGVPRFRMLEPVRDVRGGSPVDREASALADRHADYFAALCAEAHVGLRGMDLRQWLDRLDRRARQPPGRARRRCWSAATSRAAASLGEHTWLYWALRGHAGEGLLWWQARAGRGPGRVSTTGPGRGPPRARRAPTRDRRPRRGADASPRQRWRSPDLWRTGPSWPRPSCWPASGATFTGDLDGRGGPAGRSWPTSASTQDDGSGRVPMWLIASAQLSLDAGGPRRAALPRSTPPRRLSRDGAGPFTLATVLNMQTTVALLAGDDDAALPCAAEAAADRRGGRHHVDTRVHAARPWRRWRPARSARGGRRRCSRPDPPRRRPRCWRWRSARTSTPPTRTWARYGPTAHRRASSTRRGHAGAPLGVPRMIELIPEISRPRTFVM